MLIVKASSSTINFPSKSTPGVEYQVQAVLNNAGFAYLSCNCRGWTTSTRNRGLSTEERSCTHCETVITRNQSFIAEFERIIAKVRPNHVWYFRGKAATTSDLAMIFGTAATALGKLKAAVSEARSDNDKLEMLNRTLPEAQAAARKQPSKSRPDKTKPERSAFDDRIDLIEL